MTQTPEAERHGTCAECGYPLFINSDGELFCATWGCPRVSPSNAAPEDRPDLVNHPAHYNTGNIQVIDFILDQEFGYLAGQCVKYLARYRHKNRPLEDLRKCEWYLRRLIASMEGEK